MQQIAVDIAKYIWFLTFGVTFGSNFFQTDQVESLGVDTKSRLGMVYSVAYWFGEIDTPTHRCLNRHVFDS